MNPTRTFLMTAIALLALAVGLLWFAHAREQSRLAEQRKDLHGDFNNRFQPTLPPVQVDPPPR